MTNHPTQPNTATNDFDADAERKARKERPIPYALRGLPPALCVPEQEYDIHDAPTSPGSTEEDFR
jgi:hypothetical protein